VDAGGEGRAGGGARARVGAAVAGLGVVIGTLGWVLPHTRAEAMRQPVRTALDNLARKQSPAAERLATATAAREALTRVVEIDPGNAQAWADRAYAASILAHDEPAREKTLGIEAEADARRALAHGDAEQEYWLRLGVALDMQDRWYEAGTAFDEALRRAPVRASTWFYYAYHLSLNRVALPRARAAIATCLRLDPSLPEAETLRQHLAAGR
jgi:tetratricopeptide (TPR) repeat protein